MYILRDGSVVKNSCCVIMSIRIQISMPYKDHNVYLFLPIISSLKKREKETLKFLANNCDSKHRIRKLYMLFVINIILSSLQNDNQ